MQYFGGKARLGKKIAHVLNGYTAKYQVYIEPFVGGANVIQYINHANRWGFDKHEKLIALYRKLQQGWIPPKEVTEAMYFAAKSGALQDEALCGFIGFGCSYSGKWFGGYARNASKRNYAFNAANSLLKKRNLLENVYFDCKDYSELEPRNALIYCDPPYLGTTGYGLGEFDTDLFWHRMRLWANNNNTLIFISEYNAPSDIKLHSVFQTKTDIRTKHGKEARMEKLFVLGKDDI